MPVVDTTGGGGGTNPLGMSGIGGGGIRNLLFLVGAFENSSLMSSLVKSDLVSLALGKGLSFSFAIGVYGSIVSAAAALASTSASRRVIGLIGFIG